MDNQVSVARWPSQTVVPQFLVTHQQPSSHPGSQPRPGKKGEQEEEFARVGKCIQPWRWPVPPRGTYPPTFSTQWEVFQLEGGQSDQGREEAGGRETIELACSLWKLSIF